MDQSVDHGPVQTGFTEYRAGVGTKIGSTAPWSTRLAVEQERLSHMAETSGLLSGSDQPSGHDLGIAYDVSRGSNHSDRPEPAA